MVSGYRRHQDHLEIQSYRAYKGALITGKRLGSEKKQTLHNESVR